MALKDLLKTGAATATPTIPKPSSGGGLKSLLLSSASPKAPAAPIKPVIPAGAIPIKSDTGNPKFQTPSGGTIEFLPDGNKVATFPPQLGGGAYNINTANTNKIINTGHTNYGGEAQKKGVQRDDIFPVSLGGINQNPANIKDTQLKEAQDLDKLEIQTANDVKSGKISLAQGRLRIINAKQQVKPDLLTRANDVSENVLGAGATVLGSIFDVIGKGAKAVEKGLQTPANLVDQLQKGKKLNIKEAYNQAPTIGQQTGEIIRPLVAATERKLINQGGVQKGFDPTGKKADWLDALIASFPDSAPQIVDDILVPAAISGAFGSEVATRTLNGKITPNFARTRLASEEPISPQAKVILEQVIKQNKSIDVNINKPAGGFREFIGKYIFGGRAKSGANLNVESLGPEQGGPLPAPGETAPPTTRSITPTGEPSGGPVKISLPAQAPAITPGAPVAAAVNTLGQITPKAAAAPIQPTAPKLTPPAQTIQQPATPATPDLEGLKKANPQLFAKATKAKTLDEFLTTMGTQEKVDYGVLTDFYNKVKGTQPAPTPAPTAAPGVVKPPLTLEVRPPSGPEITKEIVIKAAQEGVPAEGLRENFNDSKLLVKLTPQEFASLPENIRSLGKKDRFPVLDASSHPDLPKAVADKFTKIGQTIHDNLKNGNFEVARSGNNFTVQLPDGVFNEFKLKSNAKSELPPKPVFNKGKLKTLLTSNKEFAAKPYLTVIEQDGKKLLEFKGATSRFAIQAEALGLTPDKLKVGDKIFLDKKTLEAKNDEIRVMQNKGGKSSVYASRDKFAENTPVEEGTKPEPAKSGLVYKFEGTDKSTYSDVPIELGGEGTIKPIEMPEIVKLARELMHDFPSVAKLRGNMRGFFRPRGRGQIALDAEIFKDPIQAAKTLAHEIGHLIDYLPEHLMQRGNLVGRLFTLRNFLKSTFNGEGSLDRAKVLKQYLEDENITTTEWQKDKEIRAKHEPLFEQYYNEAAKAGGYIRDPVVRKELLEVTHYWKPWDPAKSPPSFNAYRTSSTELYADALSMLINSPGTLERMAPTFYKTFFDKLDQKTAVKEAYFGLQELLTGAPEEVLKARAEDIRKGFARAEALQKDFQAKKKLNTRSLWDKLRQQLDNINQPILNKQHAAEARGEIIAPEDNPEFLLQENSLVDNENFLMIKGIHDDIVVPLEKAGMTMDDLGEYLLLKRIVNERTEIANPFGHTPKTAAKQLEHLKENVGPENYKLLETKLQQFHDVIFKSVEEAVRVGSYNKKLFETTIKPNKDSYASFAVVDYMQDYIPATVKAQVGTLKEVANPFNTTILKTVALNRLNALQRAKNGTIKLLQTSYPEDIEPSKTITSDGKLKIFKTPIDKGRIEVLVDGKLTGFDVDPYIAESFNKMKTGDLNVMVHLLSMFNNKFFKPVVTTYNLGFAAAFNPIRDFKRNYKLIPNATIRNLLVAYIKSIPSAVKFTKGQMDELTQAMVESKAIDAPIGEYNFYDRENDHYNDILKRYNIIPKDVPEGRLAQYADKAKRTILKPIVQVLEGIRFVANTLEINSKIAGYKIRKAGGESGQQLAYNIRNVTGTPNFRVRGSQTGTTNNIFVFSNIIKEGLKTDLSVAFNPKTRSGFWWKTVKIELLPKFLMFLAAGGFLGKKLKDFFDKATEYDKTNYIIIPLGYYGPDKKAVYMRIPHDDTGRLFGSIFWKMANFAKNHKTSDLQDIVSLGAGQLPSVTPAIDIVTNWAQYLSGKNPYDAFRGRQIVDDVSWTAGGGAALKKMVQWTLNDLGLSSFATFDTSSNTGVETFMQVAPWFRSLFKITNYGLQEQLKKEGTPAQQEAARLSLKRRDVVSKYAQDINDPADITNSKLHEIGKAIYGDAYDPTKQDGQLKNSLLQAAIKNDGDPRVGSLISATTNKQKASILSKIKAGMDDQEYKDFTDRLVKFKVITRPLLLLVK